MSVSKDAQRTTAAVKMADTLHELEQAATRLVDLAHHTYDDPDLWEAAERYRNAVGARNVAFDDLVKVFGSAAVGIGDRASGPVRTDP